MNKEEFKNGVDKIIELKGKCNGVDYYINCSQCVIMKACFAHPDVNIPYVPYTVAHMIRDRGYDYESVLFDLLL